MAESLKYAKSFSERYFDNFTVSELTLIQGHIHT